MWQKYFVGLTPSRWLVGKIAKYWINIKNIVLAKNSSVFKRTLFVSIVWCLFSVYLRVPKAYLWYTVHDSNCRYFNDIFRTLVKIVIIIVIIIFLTKKLIQTLYIINLYDIKENPLIKVSPKHSYWNFCLYFENTFDFSKRIYF